MQEIFNNLVTLIKTQIASNQFLSGGLVLGMVTSVLYSMKTIPAKIWSFIRRRVIFEVAIEQNDDLFPWLQNWMNANYSSELRNVKATYWRSSDNHSEDSFMHGDKKTTGKLGAITFNQYGDEFVTRYKGRVIKIAASKEKMDGARDISFLYFEKYIISGLFAKKVIMQLLNEVVEYNSKLEKEKITPKVYVSHYESWVMERSLKLRSIDHVFIKASIKERLLRVIDNFISDKAFYAAKSIPYRMGILLEGPPGTGKSSLASALASYCKRDLYIMNMKSYITDQNFQDGIRNVSKGSIVLIEDIDRYFTGDKSESKVNYSTFINELSGVKAREDIILIVTTNHKDNLDAALLRSGRLDHHFTIGNPDINDVSAYVSWFFDTPVQFNHIVNYTMADVENICVQNKYNQAEAVNKILAMGFVAEAERVA